MSQSHQNAWLYKEMDTNKKKYNPQLEAFPAMLGEIPR